MYVIDLTQFLDAKGAIAPRAGPRPKDGGIPDRRRRPSLPRRRPAGRRALAAGWLGPPRRQGDCVAARAAGRFPVYPGCARFRRLGCGYWNTDLDVSGALASDDGFAPVIGLGIEYSGSVTGASRLGLSVE
jgi:hypothetical protein